MGVNCNISLPANVRVDDVASVMGAAAGCEVRKMLLNGTDSWAVRVLGVDVRGSDTCPGMAVITIHNPTLDSESKHWCYYHFEHRGGRRLLSPKSTAFWIAVGRRLVEFFGGRIDYRNCADVGFLEIPDKPDGLNHAEDGAEWDALQMRIAAVKPITKAEWRSLDAVAAYKIGG